jgi:hypothetical protein
LLISGSCWNRHPIPPLAKSSPCPRSNSLRRRIIAASSPSLSISLNLSVGKSLNRRAWPRPLWARRQPPRLKKNDSRRAPVVPPKNGRLPAALLTPATRLALYWPFRLLVRDPNFAWCFFFFSFSSETYLFGRSISLLSSMITVRSKRRGKNREARPPGGYARPCFWCHTPDRFASISFFCSSAPQWLLRSFISAILLWILGLSQWWDFFHSKSSGCSCVILIYSLCFDAR